MDAKKIALSLIILCMISFSVGLVSLFKKPSCSSCDGSFLASDSKIALIKLEGPIEASSNEGGLFPSLYDAQNVRKSLKKALKDRAVKGILLQINSPGGTVAMSQEIYSLVLKIRKHKPVVVSMGDIAASGGYYIASAADRIFAYPGTLTGSIGVIFNSVEASELLGSRLGIKSQVIKSGKFKDIGSIYRPMSTEERGLLKGIIDDSYSQFFDAIQKGRIQRSDSYTVAKTDLNIENLKAYADGRIFTGKQAKDLGFVDEVGGLDDAHKAINDILKTKKKLPLIPYNKTKSFSELFMNLSEATSLNNLTKSLLPFSVRNSHKLLYVWE